MTEQANEFNHGPWGVKINHDVDPGLRFPNQDAARTYLVDYAKARKETGLAAYKGLSTFMVVDPEDKVIRMNGALDYVVYFVEGVDDDGELTFVQEKNAAETWTSEEAEIIIQAFGARFDLSVEEAI